MLRRHRLPTVAAALGGRRPNDPAASRAMSIRLESEGSSRNAIALPRPAFASCRHRVCEIAPHTAIAHGPTIRLFELQQPKSLAKTIFQA